MRPLALAAALCFALSAPVTGQTLPSGTWGGTISPPDDTALNVEYEVSNEGGQLSITLVLEGESFPFENVQLRNRVLTFTWNAGNELSCRLVQNAKGGLDGRCVDSSGSSGMLTMTPPKG